MACHSPLTASHRQWAPRSARTLIVTGTPARIPVGWTMLTDGSVSGGGSSGGGVLIKGICMPSAAGTSPIAIAIPLVVDERYMQRGRFRIPLAFPHCSQCSRYVDTDERPPKVQT